jgi:hypothetical protein
MTNTDTDEVDLQGQTISPTGPKIRVKMSIFVGEKNFTSEVLNDERPALVYFRNSNDQVIDGLDKLAVRIL